MVEILVVGPHEGTWANGSYEASVLENGDVQILTKFPTAAHEYKVRISPKEWDRLVAWVGWQHKK